MSDSNGLQPEITITDQLFPVPPEAIAELEEVRRKRALIGIPGHVILRIDDAPGKPPDWSVSIGETVVSRRKRSWRR